MEPLVNGLSQNGESQNDLSQNGESQDGVSGESEMGKICIPLRPHHGMCLAYFEGKGYSEGFAAHMQKVLELLTGKISEVENLPETENLPEVDNLPETDNPLDEMQTSCDVCKQSGPRDVVNEEDASNAEKKYIRLVTHTDEICRACPNNESGVCREAARVLGFDRGVLKMCGLKDGQTLEFGEFARLVQEKILAAGKRGEICGSCQWETICANRESRWSDRAVVLPECAYGHMPEH
ncbi:MAG: DUF1284 domain-containing protein [Lachnospiraceae bacterium]|nr:DUF1284 domain-containing protein [Lachnospiraceae bacterium]